MCLRSGSRLVSFKHQLLLLGAPEVHLEIRRVLKVAVQVEALEARDGVANGSREKRLVDQLRREVRHRGTLNACRVWRGPVAVAGRVRVLHGARLELEQPQVVRVRVRMRRALALVGDCGLGALSVQQRRGHIERHLGPFHRPVAAQVEPVHERHPFAEPATRHIEERVRGRRATRNHERAYSERTKQTGNRSMQIKNTIRVPKKTPGN